jgi:septum formation protein
MRFVLASASPARLRVLEAAGLAPEVIVSGIDEGGVTGNPTDVARNLAAQKAEAVAATVAGTAVVLGCDSLLELDGERLGKPASREDAVARWRNMRGRTGILHTGHCLIRTDTGQQLSAIASTSVTFGYPSDEEIATYVASGEPQHVAGAFTIDGLGGWFIDRLDGDHTNVIGVSLPTLRRLLHDLGLSVTDLWRPPARPSGGSRG